MKMLINKEVISFFFIRLLFTKKKKKKKAIKYSDCFGYGGLICNPCQISSYSAWI